MRPVRATSEQLAIGVIFIAVAVLACLAPAQGDTWWLLRAGRDIWATGQVPLTETYSHTANGVFWPNHEWLTEAVFFALHQLGGMPAIALVCAVTATAAWAAMYSLTRGSFEARLVVLLACLAPTAIVFALRPQMLTLGFFALTCWLLVRGRLWPVPLVVLVWANFHGAVALGLVAIVGTALAALLTTRRPPVGLIVTGLASGLATLATPLGSRLWHFWIESPQRSEVNTLIEWRPPDFSPVMWPFWGVAIALVLLVGLRRRLLDPRTVRLVCIAVAVLPLALQAVRNVPVFLLVALPALTSVLASGSTRVARAPKGENERLNGRLLAGTGIAAAALVALAWTVPPPALGWRPISPAAAAAIAACEGPLFNQYVDGGAIMWFVPSKPVFIDNRQDPYPMELLDASRRAELEGAHERVFETFDIRCAVLPPGSPIASALERDARWVSTYSDTQWTLFARLAPRP